MGEYDNVAPYWFVSRYEGSIREGVTSPLFNYHDLFQAKAQILQEPFEELVKYIDVPGVAIGDLFYIENLVAAIEAPASGTTPTPTPISDPNNLDGIGGVDLADIIVLIQYIFNPVGTYVAPGADPNIDSNGGVNLLDVIALISVVFS